MKKLAIAGLCAIIIIIGVFMYWVSTAKPHAQFITTPPVGDSSHVLVGFTLGFPSKIYGRFVRLQGAQYTDAGVRFEQEKVWVYEDMVWGGTTAHEDTLTGLVTLEGYNPIGEYVSLLFKLRNNAHVSEAEPPLELDSGPYTISIQYKVLWFSRSCNFTYGTPIRYTLVP